MNGENGNKDFQDNLKKNPNISNRVQGSQTPENTSYLVTILIFALLSIIIASIFALKFKRRKYESS